MVRTNWKTAVAAVCILGCGAGIAISQQDDFNKEPDPGNLFGEDLSTTEQPKQKPPADFLNADDPFSASPSLPGQTKATNPINAPATILPNSGAMAPRSLQPASPSSPRFFSASPDLVDSDDPFSGPQARVQVSPEYVQAIRVLQDSEVNEEQRTAARETIRKVLAAQFDADMTSRQQQLADLEKKLARLKIQFQKRQESRSKLVELQIQLLENEATGLGFPASWNRVNNRSMPGAWFAPDAMPAETLAPAAPQTVDDFPSTQPHPAN
ncbi:MAG: hypothetical protein JNL58_27750 [Planctomyces sp.]|nr:hypothetical protein [Planctomyces sp.]